MNKVLIALGVIAALSTGCASLRTIEDEKADLTASTYNQYRVTHPHALYADVRSKAEYRQYGAVPGTSLIQFGPDRWTGEVSNTQQQDFVTRIRAQMQAMDEPVVLFCILGTRSMDAAKALSAAGIVAISVRDGIIGNRFGAGLSMYVDMEKTDK